MLLYGLHACFGITDKTKGIQDTAKAKDNTATYTPQDYVVKMFDMDKKAIGSPEMCS